MCFHPLGSAENIFNLNSFSFLYLSPLLCSPLSNILQLLFHFIDYIKANNWDNLV